MKTYFQRSFSLYKNEYLIETDNILLCTRIIRFEEIKSYLNLLLLTTL